MKPYDILKTDELPVGTVIGKASYTITDIEPASQSGFSYRATTPAGDTVVIKEFYLRDLCLREGLEVTCKSNADTKLYRRLVKNFVANAKFLTSLTCENVSNVLEVIEHNNTAYMVSEETYGVVLEELIRLGSVQFKPGQIARIANDLFTGLIEIHAFGMLHRDITPANIVITAENRAVILPDFGTFREDKSEASQMVSSTMQSSQDYAPFELIFDDASQAENSDVYCAAAVVYEMIAGKKAVKSLERVAAVAKGEDDPYVPLEGQVKGYSSRLLRSLDMSLALFMENRMRSATEFLMYQSNENDLISVQRMRAEASSRKPKAVRDGIFSRMRRIFSRK